MQIEHVDIEDKIVDHLVFGQTIAIVPGEYFHMTLSRSIQTVWLDRDWPDPEVSL